jgi:hypothetical protein
MKKFTSLLLVASAFALGALTVSAQPSPATAPKSVIHVVTVAWKAGTTPEQIKAALDGAHKLPAQYKGISRVWTNAIKVQNPQGATVEKTHVIVMEFVDQAALAAYTDHPAQLEWYKVYTPIREQSTTYDITN